MIRALAAMLLTIWLTVSGAPAAHAWSRPTHMVSAAIAWDELKRTDPDVIAAAGALLEQHPDRSSFQLAGDVATGEERIRRLFLQCPRWPDDMRDTLYDQPTWHYALSPLNADASARAGDLSGEAVEAFALNVRLLANRKARPANRAVALCWVMHVAQDIHQPLHAARIFLPGMDEGDDGGARLFVRDPQTGEPISLHWLWDNSIQRTGDVASVEGRARDLEQRYPRASLLRAPAHAAEFPAWRAESAALATSVAYAKGYPDARTADAAQPASKAYLEAMQPAAERRIMLASYRLADVLREALKGK